MFQQVISQITWHGKGDYLASVVPQGKRLTLNYFEEDLPQKRYAFCVVCLSIVLRNFSSFGISIYFAETVFELFVISRWQQICVHPPHTKTSKSGTWSLRSTFERLKNIHFSSGPVVSINFSMSDCWRCNARAVTGRGREAKPVSLLAAKQTTGLTGLTNQSLSIYYCLAVGRTFLFITSKAPLIELIFSSYFSVPSRNPKV